MFSKLVPQLNHNILFATRFADLAAEKVQELENGDESAGVHLGQGRAEGQRSLNLGLDVRPTRQNAIVHALQDLGG